MTKYRMGYFMGFSTTDSHITRKREVYDIELVRRDLLNHFFTIVGSRAMRPLWGCRIWDYVMEPLTPTARDEIIAEAVRICREDERVEPRGVVVSEVPHGLAIEITIEYRPIGKVETFTVNFDRRNAALWG